MGYYERTGTPAVNLSWQKTSPAGSAPVISSFPASPATITAGQSTTLSWIVSGASAAGIDNGVEDVSNPTPKTVGPIQTTTYKLTAVNSSGTTTAAVTVTVNPKAGSDSEQPTSPVLSSAAASGPTQVLLAWAASTDNVAVASYEVVRNGSPLASVAGLTWSYTDSGAAANTSYTYSVRAFDAAGNCSSPSNTLAVTTPPPNNSSACVPATGVFTGCYYGNPDLTGRPLLIRTNNQINFDWMFAPPDKSLPMTNYSVRWQGNFTSESADYTFYATTSDGMRIYIGGNLILDRWRDQPMYIYVIRRTLTPGTHLVTV